MKLRATLTLVCSFGMLAGCSGGSSRLSPLTPTVTLPRAAPQRASTLGDDGHRKGSLTVSIRIPRRPHQRGARYVSPSTAGAVLIFSGAETLTVVAGLSEASNPNGCTTARGTTTCTIPVRLRSGQYKATISTYDRAPVKGSIPGSAHVLSTASNLPLTITTGKANQAKFTLEGVVASLSVSGLPSAAIGTTFSSPKAFSVVAKDADGDTIVGGYNRAITLSTSDAANAAVATSGSDSPPAGELLSSADVATLHYTGAPIVSAKIGASVSLVSASATFAPAPVLSSIGLSNASGAGSVSSALIGAETVLTLNGHFATGPGNNPTTVNVTVTGASLTRVNVASATTITADLFLDPHVVSAGSIGVTAKTSAGASSAHVNVTASSTGVHVVTVGSDSEAGTPPGTGGGAIGDLRYTLLIAGAGDTIVFDTQSMCGGSQCTITLSGPLPPIQQNLIIDGGSYSGTARVAIDGANTYRAFWVDTGTVMIANLEIQNANAQGGNGGGSATYTSGAGGGGAGLGAGLFVNKSSADASVVNDYFYNTAVQGGNGGVGNGTGGGGGGGGLGGNGGVGTTTDTGGNGGGGILAAGTNASGADGAAGGSGGGGGGGLECSQTGSTGSGGAAYAGNTAGSAGSGNTGGAGGFGGGGGGAGWTSLSTPCAVGGAGGFGGGGGGSGGTAAAGDGGPGGGGGGSFTTPATGGALSLTISGGAGDNTSHGGGGAAVGPAIFVNAGSLTTDNSGASISSATGGSAGGGTATAGDANSAPVFDYGGTVNGVTVSAGSGGPVVNALGSSAPSLRRLPHRTRVSVKAKP